MQSPGGRKQWQLTVACLGDVTLYSLPPVPSPSNLLTGPSAIATLLAHHLHRNCLGAGLIQSGASMSH